MVQCIHPKKQQVPQLVPVKEFNSFPVSLFHRKLKKVTFGNRIERCAAVYLATVLEYLSFEILKMAGDCTRERKKKRIMSRYLKVAVDFDPEFHKLLGHVIIAEAGSMPFMYSAILKSLKECKAMKEQKKIERQKVEKINQLNIDEEFKLFEKWINGANLDTFKPLTLPLSYPPPPVTVSFDDTDFYMDEYLNV